MDLELNELLAYDHQGVVNRYKKDHPDKAAFAEVLFKDLLRFFWASKKHQLDKRARPQSEDLDFIFIMDDEMRDIDQIWHIFLLYTEDYMNFCQKFFGEFLHHRPDIVPMMESGVLDSSDLFQENLEKFLAYNFDLLGEDVVRRWFAKSLEHVEVQAEA